MNGAGSPRSIVTGICVHNQILVVNVLFCWECFEENSVFIHSFPLFIWTSWHYQIRAFQSRRKSVKSQHWWTNPNIDPIRPRHTSAHKDSQLLDELKQSLSISCDVVHDSAHDKEAAMPASTIALFFCVCHTSVLWLSVQFNHRVPWLKDVFKGYTDNFMDFDLLEKVQYEQVSAFRRC